MPAEIQSETQPERGASSVEATASARGSKSSLGRDLRKLAAFGSGVGIQIGERDLEIVAVRVRLARVRVLGFLRVDDFASRPAAEWGAEYAAMLKSRGVSYLGATVLLPRHEVIVRHLALPGVAAKDMEAAIRLQLDSLHPYGEDEISWGWSALGPGAALLGVARQSVIDRYVSLFAEAGIAVAGFTFSAAAVHAAIRLNDFEAGAGFVAVSRASGRAVEIYGESDWRPLFSAAFELPAERAAQLALAELRLAPDTVPVALEQVLPKPTVNPVENDLSRNALPYATALAGACPWLSPMANLLPVEHRSSSSRGMLVPTVVLASLAVLLTAGIWGYPRYAEHRYLESLRAEIARLQPQAQRAMALDHAVDRARARTRLLDQFRARTRNDLDALNELTRLVEPPSWTNSIEITRTGVRINGEAPQAAPLLKILDSSPLFQDSGMDMAQRSQSGTGEVFQIHSNRRGQP
ncbi:MAG: PilN domain-containing protein [Bryobacteraceae bacterium]|jgi:hypothetical protein